MSGSEKPIEGIEVDEVSGEIRETPEARQEGLRRLRDMMDGLVAKGKVKQWCRTDDGFLLAFLRARKYKLKAALEVVLNFNKFWYGNPDLINGLCAAKVRRVYELGMMQFLPGTDIHGNTVTALRMAAMDYSKFSPTEMIQLSVYILCYLFEQEGMQTHGAAYVESMEGFSMLQSMAMSRYLSRGDYKVMMSIGLDTFPMRIRDIYLIHQPGWFSVFWGMVKVFLKDKLKKRLHVLGKDTAALHAVFPPENLPPDFGGTCTEPPSAFLDKLEALEKAHGKLGGFAMPMSVEDPMGVNRGLRAG